jgi:hypothetical protein
MTPSRDESVTILGSTRSARCSMCGLLFAARGRQLWCSAACRQKAFRRRSQLLLPTPPAMLRRVGQGRATTVYACPQCESRAVGTQRCDDCNCFGVRVGVGGLCPHCEEPVALVDLLPELAPLLEGKP